MNSISVLDNVHKKGLFGNYENKKDIEILKISESKNLFICQVVKYKNSSIDEKKLKIDELDLPDTLKTTFNDKTRILWMGPSNWLVISKKLDLIKIITTLFDDKNFAITDLSHSRTIIEIEGDLADEIIKKGCPLNINELEKGDCANSSFHGITVTIDFLSNDPKKIRLLALRSFGESLYHSVTDACLEYGYKAV
tara:strand:- start:156 stop:740 length:585 start_codon:yes stop_codon:yes gene_type:complete